MCGQHSTRDYWRFVLPTCGNEKRVYIWTNKTTSFYECKKSKDCCHVLNISLGTKNRQLCCLAVMVRIVLQERRVATTEKKSSSFSRKFLRQSVPSISEPASKKAKMRPNMEQTYPFPIGWWFEQHILFSNQFIQFQSTVNFLNVMNLQSTYRKSWSF